MLRPKIPTMPLPTGLVTPPAVVHPTAIQPAEQPSALVVPTPAPGTPARPIVQVTPGTALAVIGAGTAVVLVVGTVLVSMLLATAVTAASVAVCAVVVRSLMASPTKRQRR
ncbi:SpdD-like protein [Streptomyces sp. NPDC059556]|uniref:SpdD-like protein n=1 Tax=Streptomyces sp. NPDC059556 TaxID=3346863 RepID=UPI0036AF9994